MELQAYRDEIRLALTAYVLDLELDDATIDAIINSSLREIQKYYSSTKLATIPYAYCIDLSECNVSSVTGVFRAEGYLNPTQDSSNPLVPLDPMYMAQWQSIGSGNIYYLSNWVLNYGAWNTMMQIRNTVSTDLIFRFDKSTDRLYINVAADKPQSITIEYIPKLQCVEEVTSDFWIDNLMKMCVAKAKVAVGRVRSKFSQSNALWATDGATILEEGNSELAALREYLINNNNVVYPID